MAVINVFGKGGSTYGKHLSRLNFISDKIDRRRKENSSYRTSRPRQGKLVKEDGQTFILFKDGEKVKSNIKLK